MKRPRSKPAISVCIPARNEERYLPVCLQSIRAAEKELGEPVEIVVALNRCTDRTEAIARSFGAVIVREDAKNLSRIRNAAVNAARAPIVATIDADCRMSPGMLAEIKSRISSGRTVGGGVLIKNERLSVGIAFTTVLIAALVLPLGISGGLFWFRKSDFKKIGGFDESLLTGEDVDFALRLKRLGRREKKRFATILNANIVASCRKFDQFGEWYLVNPALLWRMFQGRSREDADRIWYDVKR